MMYGYSYANPMMGVGFGMGLMVFWAIVVVVLILVLIRDVRRSGISHTPPNAPPAPQVRDEACEIARARYAKGEITKEQYEDMCRTLST
jgi:uncharacterized membrane protein